MNDGRSEDNRNTKGSLCVATEKLVLKSEANDMMNEIINTVGVHVQGF